MMPSKQTVRNAIKLHISRFWHDHKIVEFHPELGPIHEVFPEFSIQIVQPRDPTDPWIYITNGAWEIGTERGFGQEFLILSKYKDAKQIETLSMMAYLHADPRYTIDLGRSLNIGRAWSEGSSFDKLLVTIPYPFGPELETCDLGDFRVYFLWVVPISDSEDQYMRAHGNEALEKLLEESQIDVVDPQRKPVV